MNAPPRLLGAVLAGGRSRRLGRDKAAVSIGGLTLLERAVRTLSEVCDDVVVSGHVAGEGAVRGLPDLRAGAGPLAGLESALTEADRRGFDAVALLAVDLPLVTAPTVRALALALGSADAALPARDGSPPVEPLCGVYATRCLDAAAGLLDGGERAAHALAEAVRTVRVPLPDHEFLNVNTESELAVARRSLDGGTAPDA